MGHIIFEGVKGPRNHSIYKKARSPRAFLKATVDLAHQIIASDENAHLAPLLIGVDSDAIYQLDMHQVEDNPSHYRRSARQILNDWKVDIAVQLTHFSAFKTVNAFPPLAALGIHIQIPTGDEVEGIAISVEFRDGRRAEAMQFVERDAKTKAVRFIERADAQGIKLPWAEFKADIFKEKP